MNAAASPTCTRFQNWQWTVDLDGIEGNPATGRYFLPLDSIDQTTARNSATFYDLPIHMAEKELVDIDLFFAAFEYALRLWAKLAGQMVDEAMLIATFQEARAIAEECRALAEIGSRRYTTEADRYMPMFIEELALQYAEDKATLERERPQRLAGFFPLAMF